MIDMIYNLRVGDIHAAEFSDEFNRLCIPFENSLNKEQIDVFHKILDCVSDTAAAEMRAAYKVGFKDSVALIVRFRSSIQSKTQYLLTIEDDFYLNNPLFLYENIENSVPSN